jgi:hypothetical protein
MNDAYDAFRKAVEQLFPGGFTLRDEANAIVAYAFRNGPIEDLHAGELPPPPQTRGGFSCTKLKRTSTHRMAPLQCHDLPHQHPRFATRMDVRSIRTQRRGSDEASRRHKQAIVKGPLHCNSAQPPRPYCR